MTLSSNTTGSMIIISAPSGCGKTTIVDRLIKRRPEIKRSVSYTTRSPRDNERSGEDYFFISEREFKRKRDNGEFLEWEENFGEYYATEKAQIKDALYAGHDIILSIDVKGAKKVLEAYPKALSIFILPPSEEVLENRLKERDTDEQNQLRLRLEEASKEIAASALYRHKVVNEDLEEAVNAIETIIEREKTKRTEQC